MEEISFNKIPRLPKWLLKLCKVFWKILSIFWSLIFVGLVINIISSLLFVPLPLFTSLRQTLLEKIFENSNVTLLLLIILLLLTCLCGLINRLPVDISHQDLKKYYLKHMILETERLALKGIPADLISESVPLDAVFLPVQFRPNRPLKDYPLRTSEFLAYRKRLLRKTETDEDTERLLFEAEKSWQRAFKEDDRISIANLWDRLPKNQPTAVIQGYPGMGKSTLLARLALHMARLGLRHSDPHMTMRLKPRLIPIFLSLGAYALECEKVPDLSLAGYLKLIIDQHDIPGLTQLLFRYLELGSCLVMLDGLDEISSEQMHIRVQEAIKSFVIKYRNTPEIPSKFKRFLMRIKNTFLEYTYNRKVETKFNRFLITSRVAGYDQAAFPDYVHYTIAELTAGQISDFLPRWSRALACLNPIIRNGSRHKREKAITEEAELIARDLKVAIELRQGVHDLAENPLLLSLLAMMQQNRIELPRQRVELYRFITLMLMENRNKAQKLPMIPEMQAIYYLGQLAVYMQEKGNSFIRRSEVVASLRRAISLDRGVSEEEIDEIEVATFLQLVRARGGLFVLRTGDYFGFVHRTFQEYFAARYLLSQMKDNPDHLIEEFVNKALDKDDLWREPLLLAVGYISKEDEVAANKIINTLIVSSQITHAENRQHNILLAVECVLEAKPFVLSSELEKQLAELLFRIYEEAQQDQRFETCNEIETIVLRWLLSLPREAHHIPLLSVIKENIESIQHTAVLRATLTLLTMIAGQLKGCPTNVFGTLIPPLLALTNLPSISGYQSSMSLSTVPDPSIADLALLILSFMGKQGPSGLLLADIRLYFKVPSESLRLLARYSLESCTLLTPTVVPQDESNYYRYQSAIFRWIELNEHHKPNHITEREVHSCLKIHQELLDNAEELSYPGFIHFLNILYEAIDHPDWSWRQIWKNYLLNQLRSSNYIHYQEIILIWTITFSDEDELKELATILLEFYKSDGKPSQRYIQHFLAALSYNLRFLQNPHEQLDLRRISTMSYLKYLRDLRDLQNIRYGDTQLIANLMKMMSARHIAELFEMEFLKEVYINYWDLDYVNLRYMRSLRNAQYLSYMKYLMFMIDFKNLQKILFTRETAEETLRRLSAVQAGPLNDPSEYLDLLAIILGRILHILKFDEMNEIVNNELQQIVKALTSGLLSTNNVEVYEILLDIIGFLPIRSENEIRIVLQLAEEITDERVHYRCAAAIKHGEPKGPKAWEMLKFVTQSQVKIVRNAAEERLKQN